MNKIVNIKKSNVALMGSLSAIVEYYDFIIYGMMAIYLSEVFFTKNTEVDYLKTFSILAIGYIARPLGGYIFGIISDLYGRKKGLVWVMSLMAFSTLLIACTPTYSQAGLLAPIVLTIARILQGISFGAEMPTLTTAIAEQHQKSASGKHFGLLISSTSVGALLASFVVFCIGKFFTHDEVVAWAWRIPFILGACLALVVFIIRSQMEETPDFEQTRNESRLSVSSKNITRELFAKHKMKMLSATTISLFFSFLIIFSLYLPVYLKQYFNVEVDRLFSTMTFGIFISMLVAPLFGQFFNRFNRIKVLQVTSSLFIIFIICSLKFFKFNNNLYSLYFFIVGYQIFIAAYSTNILYLVSKIFPLHIRTTGIGISYNLAYALASLTPMALNLIVQYHHELSVILFSAFISMVAISGSLIYYRTQAES